MRILKFKSQLTIAFSTAVNHLNGPLRKQNLTLTGSKGQGLWFVIGGFSSVLCVFVACDRNYDRRQRKTQLWRRLLNFRVRMFVKSAVIRLYLFTFNSLKLVSIPYRLITWFFFFYTFVTFTSLSHPIRLVYQQYSFLQRKITSTYGLFFRRKPPVMTYCNEMTYTV